MVTAAIQILEDECESALVELFEHYLEETGCVVRIDAKFADISARETDQAIVASCGLVGEEFCVSGGLMMSVGSINDRYAATLERQADWLGELTNQWIGRLKNKLTRYKVSSQMTLPMTMTGTCLRFSPSASHRSVWQVSWPNGIAWCALVADVPSAVSWTRRDDATAALEGSLEYLF